MQESGLFGYARQLSGVFNEIFLQIDRCSHMHYYASVLCPRATKNSPSHAPQNISRKLNWMSRGVPTVPEITPALVLPIF